MMSAPMHSRIRPRCWLFALALGTVLKPAPAQAESVASGKAAAEALYQQASDLFSRGNLAAACDKFEASHELDPALGTMLRLADCLDRTGKTASAWALFLESATIARGRNEDERERIATERAAHLEQRLSLIELRKPNMPSEVTLSVKLNGTSIPLASLGAPIPIDPGRVVVEVSAPGYTSWTGELTVPQGPILQVCELPALPDSDERQRVGERAPVRARESELRPSSSPLRTVGFVTGGTGVLGLGGALLLGLRASDLKSRSLSHCQAGNSNACDETGYELRERALWYADAATVSAAAGGALVLTGVGLIVFAPPGAPVQRSTRHVRLDAAPVRGGVSLRLKGRF